LEHAILILSIPPLCLQIPFDKITDCDIVEPAGISCVCIPNTLYSVHIDTASSEKGSHELNITGLKDPHAFKRLVWAMKRATVDGHPAGACLPAALEMVDRGSSSDEVVKLLREIRDELRQQKASAHNHQLLLLHLLRSKTNIDCQICTEKYLRQGSHRPRNFKVEPGEKERGRMYVWTR
jgi:hypothetical protein